MAYIEITSFITRAGVPATDIDDLNPHLDGRNYPRLRIWEIDGGTQDLIIGDPAGSGLNTDAIMSPVIDGVEDGFYSYVFDTVEGYDVSKKYLIRVDGGPSLSDNERYQTGQIVPIENDIINGVWDENITDHLTVNSTGLTLSQIKADTTSLFVSLTDVANLMSLALKYDTNRTKIDTVNHLMIIYDDDCVTELRRFQLFDSGGVPNSSVVCERKPISASDGEPVCT